MKYFFATLTSFALLFSAAIAHADDINYTPPTASQVIQQSDCSATNVVTSTCYERMCTGQSNEDSVSCNNFASTWTSSNNPDNPQCYSIGPTNEDQCCPNGESDSPICAAYDTYTDRDATTEAYSRTVIGQVGSGTQNTNPVNNAYSNGEGNPSLTIPTYDAAAATSCSNVKFTNLLNIAIWAKCIIGVIIIPGIFTLAFVVFLWGVFKFIRASEEKDKQAGKQFIYMGLIGLFIMVAVWGIINIAIKTLGFNSVVPTLQTDYLSPSSATAMPTSTSTGTN